MLLGMSIVETIIFVLVPGVNAQFKRITLAQNNSRSGENWSQHRACHESCECFDWQRVVTKNKTLLKLLDNQVMRTQSWVIMKIGSTIKNQDIAASVYFPSMTTYQKKTNQRPCTQACNYVQLCCHQNTRYCRASSSSLLFLMRKKDVKLRLQYFQHEASQ